MPNPHGSFIWYELLTKDPKAAKAFYDDVVGWNIDAEAPPGGMDYRMIVAHDGNVGGVMGLNAEMLAGGAQPVWLGYFGVNDVDASVASIVAAGGQVHLPAFDIPDIGRLAMVTDPQGVPFYVMRGSSDESSTAYQRTGLGHVSWNELLTPDDAAALAFYDAQFNIKKTGAMPMGEMGDYSFIAHGDDPQIGAVMKTPPGAKSGWSFYFRVPDIDAAKAKIEARGGTVRQGPMEVPGGEWVLNATDPEGVVFGLVAPAKS
jgi:predicted enzyme related to lactoylglutathione lyase